MSSRSYASPCYDDFDEPVIFSCALRHICEHMEVVLDQLYSKEKIDLGLLENSLDEVVHGIGLRLPINDLTITRKYEAKLCHIEDDSNLYDEIAL